MLVFQRTDLLHKHTTRQCHQRSGTIEEHRTKVGKAKTQQVTHTMFQERIPQCLLRLISTYSEEYRKNS